MAPRIRQLPLVPEDASGSFAGGVAVTYVFLHLLPELAEGNESLREVLGEQGDPSPLLGLEVFFVALVGFAVFYGLDRLAHRSRREDASAAPAVFWLHLSSFMLYNAIIAYSLPLNYRTSVPFAALFTVAMALHFILVDRGLEEHYGKRFDRRGPRLRWQWPCWPDGGSRQSLRRRVPWSSPSWSPSWPAACSSTSSPRRSLPAVGHTTAGSSWAWSSTRFC
ncbi:hypothetical protein [Ornithinimicrobium sp. W1665]|uniref:hypothetical protein n=1 Tax=Ornithinimicrobium sp. W1665 TaxID=3416666 RepID=UPI003D6BD9DE